MPRPRYSIPGWAAIILFAALVVANGLLPDGKLLWIRYTGVLVLVPAPVLMFLPFAQLAKYGESESNYMETKVLVDRGLYAIVRHPQYLGYILLYPGFALLSQHWITLAIAAGGVATLYSQAVAEEHFCQSKFGRAYDDYMARVPRFNLILGLWRFFNRGRCF